MIWVHCGSEDEIASTLSLVSRMIEISDPSDILLTSEKHHLEAFGVLPSDVTCVEAPPELPATIRGFITQWSPKTLIWNGGELRPILLRLVSQEGLPATLINARFEAILNASSRWMPGATRNTVAAFTKILTADGATATRLIRGGVPAERIETTGPLLEEPIALPHDRYELTVMAEAFGTRPVWLAANVLPSEISQMAEAHIAAARKNHRLILVLTPDDINDGRSAARTLREAGLKVGLRSEGDDPEPEHQVYIADLPNELGLWFRLIPLTFIGGTLAGGATASPLAPILLGSAIVHGPHKAPHAARFERLGKVGASREVRSAAELGIAIGMLVSPEQTARMALAGWEEITKNATIINQLVNDVTEARALNKANL